MPARYAVNAVLLAMLAGAPPAERLQDVRANGVSLHDVDRGTGEPIVFVHGALADYREWGPVAGLLADTYRTITYSRRYNFANDNRRSAHDHSALVEAADLAALNRRLRLGKMHVVGVSYGAYTALLLALREPQLIRTLTLVEPPLVKWLPDLPGGAALFDQFYRGTWQAAGRAFKQGDPASAMRISLDFFAGPRRLRPAGGGKTYPMLHLIDAELEKLLPNGRRVVVPDASHGVCSEQPPACAAAIRALLDRGAAPLRP